MSLRLCGVGSTTTSACTDQNDGVLMKFATFDDVDRLVGLDLRKSLNVSAGPGHLDLIHQIIATDAEKKLPGVGGKVADAGDQRTNDCEISGRDRHPGTKGIPIGLRALESDLEPLVPGS